MADRSAGAQQAERQQAERHTVVLWFRNDLRLHDNAIVAEAARRVAVGQCDQVVPLFCFEPRLFGQTLWGNPKTGPFRARFLLESVAALRVSLQSIGSDLLTVVCAPQEAVSELLESAESRGGGIVTVLTQREVTREELDVDAAVQAAMGEGGKGTLRTLWGPTLLHLEDLPFGEHCERLPESFTKFRRKVEEAGHSRVRPELPTPKPAALPLPPGGLPATTSAFRPASWQELYQLTGVSPPPEPEPEPCCRAVMRFEGGEAAGLRRLRHYVWDSDAAASYMDTRNGLLAADDSTKLSPWLALGCLSPRRVRTEVVRYEAQRAANNSTYMLTFHLLVRDYFRLFCMKHGDSVFAERGVTRQRRRWRGDPDAVRRWREGATGVPFVDAHMRELLQTGWMSNRGRQNVASYLALGLEEDWRQGADWFESRLLDYDVCSNWGNWVAAAGLAGGGGRGGFDVVKQGRTYDPKGRYIKKWVPELAPVPAEHIHEPWKMTAAEQAACGVRLPADYPMLIAATRHVDGDAAPGDAPAA